MAQTASAVRWAGAMPARQDQDEAVTTIPWLTDRDAFPPVEEALREPNGLLAAGADLSSERLIDAYRHGIFPWFGAEDPVLWWSPDPRMVLKPSELHVSRSLRRTIKSARFTVTLDRAFRDVITSCALIRDTVDTWLTPEMIEAYVRLAALGYAHSAEAWIGDELAGGLYGVAVGRMFYGESMFARQTDASKVALVMLVRQLERWGFELIDCQIPTPHLASLGAHEIPRDQFLHDVRRLSTLPPVATPWTFDL
jgi:leucyl/phenylalanyl-tRNA--protein transferase